MWKTVTKLFPSLDASRLIHQSYPNGYDDHDFEDDLQDILEAIEPFEQREVKVILLVDEGDLINEYSVQTQGKIRGLLSDNKALKMVWTGVNIVRVSRSVDSPWFNMLVTYALPPLDEAEARQLIVEPATACGYRYDLEAIQRILLFTNGKPYHIQSLCYRVIEMIRSEGRTTIKEADIEQAILDLEVQLSSSQDDNEHTYQGKIKNGIDAQVTKE